MKKQLLRMKCRSITLKPLIGILSMAVLMATPCLTEASPITMTSGSSLPIVETFDVPQMVYDPYIVGSYAQIGESFVGQNVTVLGGFGSSPNGFEFVSGMPSGPLTLQAAQNSSVITWQGNELQGLLSSTSLVKENVGEGAISFLFLTDLTEFGLDLLRFDGGTVTMQFFDRAGAHFDTISFAAIGAGPYTFRSSDGVSLFAGVTITNADDSGIAIDNLRLVPIPATILLLCSGLAGLFGIKTRYISGIFRNKWVQVCL